MAKITERAASNLGNIIGSAILVAENLLDLDPLDPHDGDQENAVAELRRTIRALHQAAEAAAGVVVATGAP